MIITVRMPASLLRDMACMTSFRGGSIIPARPEKICFDSTSLKKRGSSRLMGLPENASTLRARLAMLSAFSIIAFLSSSVSCRTVPASAMRLQRLRTASGAPFIEATRPWPGMSSTTVILLRSESKGNSTTLLLLFRSLSSMPAFLAATIIAPSVGSPTMRQPPLACSISALLHKAPICKSPTRSSDWGSIFSPFSRKEPVGV